MKMNDEITFHNNELSLIIFSITSQIFISI